ncbi:MAG TPA: hypothetical protein PK385_12695 [Spirochaetota bacterium]|jgi:hypothetical protein|nr:hypothetical protein [Spirochaetota bacterium]
MEKSTLEIEPYTISEALDAINKDLKLNFKREIKIEHLYNLIYNTVKPNLIRKRDGGQTHGQRVLIQYNEIVKIYEHIVKSNKNRYSTNGRKRAN